MKTPVPRRIGVAGEEGNAKFDPRIICALSLPSLIHHTHLGEITMGIVVSLIALRDDITRRHAGLVAQFALERRSSW